VKFFRYVLPTWASVYSEACTSTAEHKTTQQKAQLQGATIEKNI